MHWLDVMNIGGFIQCGFEPTSSSGSAGNVWIGTGCACDTIGGWTAFFSCSGSGCARTAGADVAGGGVVRHESSTLKVIGSPLKPLMLSSAANVVASFAEPWQRRQYSPKPAHGYCVPPNDMPLPVGVVFVNTSAQNQPSREADERRIMTVQSCGWS